MKTLTSRLLLFLFLISPAHALQAEVIGHIQTLQGTASIIREGKTLPAAIGVSLNREDLIRTGKPGAAGIVLTDNSTISLGPGSELSLKEYTFVPKEEKFGLVMRMTKGTFVYLSGLIGKLAPDKVHLQIPNATIGLRGTKLLIEISE
jgi:hypothetical protein